MITANPNELFDGGNAWAAAARIGTEMRFADGRCARQSAPQWYGCAGAAGEACDGSLDEFIHGVLR